VVLYTMEYYSAIKKNTCESVLMRWMKVESIIHSKISQKEKHQHSILMHTYRMPSNHLIFCCPLLLRTSIVLSICVFSNESVLCIMWPKYWSFSFSISPSNEYSGLISFNIDWLDLLAVQGTTKSLLQHHSSKASLLQCSAFCIVQLSHPYRTTGKNHSFDKMDLCWQNTVSAF